MAAFKDEVSPAAVVRLAGALERVPGFDAAGFQRRACAGLEALELKARVAHVARALSASLEGDFAALALPVAAAVRAAQLTMWEAWPAQTWVEERGLGAPDPALAAMAEMTACASAEMAVRPYLERHPERTWAAVREWSASPDMHRRRLASEGTRPRLPWARQVRALLDDPGPGLAILDRLREDPEEYVRRSVANHLNDVARDHPAVALSTAERWSLGGGEHLARVLRHGLRGLIKKGEPRALALVGVAVDVPLEVGAVEVAEDPVAIGDHLRFAATVTSRAGAPARVSVDYAISYVGARGDLKAPKVFKLGVRELAPGETWRIERRHSMRDVSIRRHHAGRHRVDLQVNGVVRAGTDFAVVAR